MLEGIAEYLTATRSWIVQRKDTVPESLESVRAFRPDGVIAVIEHPGMLKPLEGMDVPVLEVGGHVDTLRFDQVGADDHAVGREQARHLIAQGYRRLVFAGFMHGHHMPRMLAGIQEEADGTGARVETLDFSEWRGQWKSSVELDRRLGELLVRMPLPMALLTAHAEDAERLAQRCHELNLEIPDQAVIVTVNDDAVSTSLAYPEFSTVDVPWKRIGWLAANGLDARMRGKKTGEPPRIDVAPTGITERRSTESIALPDRQLARAVAHIRQRAGEKIRVDEVAKAAGMSRRLLEDRFHRHLGHSPFREIRHHQTQRVRKLLLETNLSLEEICDQSAFAYLSHMSKAFREEYGMPPGGYRRAAGSPMSTSVQDD